MALQRCVNCGREFEAGSGAAAYCPECAQQQARAIQGSQFAKNATADLFLVTIGLISVNVLVFVVMVLSGVSPFLPTPRDAIIFGADFGPLTLNGQWWRLVTSMFVHFGLIHLGLNMWCLWNLGRAAEQLMGRVAYLLGYFVSGIFGSIASVYWHPLGAGAGASGAIFGLAGVLVSFVYMKKTPAHLQINRGLLGSLGTFIFYNLVYGAAIPGISNAAHIGGLVMGLAFGALLPPATAPESSRRGRLSVAILISAAVLVGSAIAVKRIRGPEVSRPPLPSTSRTSSAIRANLSGEKLACGREAAATRHGQDFAGCDGPAINFGDGDFAAACTLDGKTGLNDAYRGWKHGPGIFFEIARQQRIFA